ncbi:hypothetical protein TREMEDRAFT_24772 [Tremella mesenterica DSM 1558]|uniref:uncharacterized protein n=1 Tax=Tremella mesenterica (strain ATCC 24925 / CBS 8224 / DSM 1558 / NBRC 9311 / NRRL Y-6157 / RJB 2259-6 / UBC 559-6) TaxID=578456 RepID=UPI0003F492FA|nr:uncharacterized protein TREMEDRAFT_24772 [Tremella mesenterica DSM 1558]EIW72677.1 hypothetical protein TREMEDRAFT_24772 [Tremella mesenterica DSM 1558]
MSSRPSIPLSERPPNAVAGPSRISRNSTPPLITDDDIAMAEAFDNDFEEELIPPSSPPIPIATPRRQKRLDGAAARRQALAELQDITPDDLFSSPPRKTPSKVPRTEASASRPDLGGPGPSSSASNMSVQAPKTYKMEVQHPWSKEVVSKLRQVFKLPRFRTHQKEAIDETMSGKDVFVLMPTGGGKSLTYQLPAVCNGGQTRGITFVVSPLISLISDQSRHLAKLGIPAIAYTGDLTQADRNTAHELMSDPEPHTKVVYVTPEMLVMGGHLKSILRLLLKRKRLARFVIDEAHCVSQWGHDFRSDYLRLGELRRDYPGVPIMALTATAQNKVQEDIIRSLSITGCAILKQSFNRPNLHYEVRPKKKSVINDMVAFINTQGKDVSGIVYCSSREKCENIAKELRDNHDLKAYHYHAGMSKNDRRKVQEGWQEHKFEIIVATTAITPTAFSVCRKPKGPGSKKLTFSDFSYADSKTVFTMIDRDTNLTRDQKERQRESMQQVLRFCMNKSDCRRSQVLAFFNETFDSSECHQGCDVCLGRDNDRFTVEDVTDSAVNVIRMVQAFDRGDRITVKMAVDAFRGVGGGGGKGLDQNPHFGCGKDWERNEAERLLQMLLIEGGLDEWYSANGAGWSNAYLKLGKQSQAYLNGRKTLKMDFRSKSPVKKKVAPTKRKSGQGNLSTYAHPMTNPLQKQRSLQKLREEEQAFENSPWGDSDDEFIPDEGDEDPIEITDDEDVIEEVTMKKRKTLNLRPQKSFSLTDVGLGANNSIGVVDRADSGTPVEKCFKALQALQKSIRSKNKAAPVLAEETLQMIAATMPSNLGMLKEIEGITSAHIKTYGTRILGICISHREPSRIALPPSRSSNPPRPLAQTIQNIQAYAYNPTASTSSKAQSAASTSRLTLPVGKSGGSKSSLSGLGETSLVGRPNGIRPVTLGTKMTKRPAF